MKCRIAFVSGLTALLVACGGGSAGVNGEAATSSTQGTTESVASGFGSDVAPASDVYVSSSANKQGSTRSSTASNTSSSSSSTVAVWTSVAPTPGQITAVSGDGVIAANSVITFGQAFKPGEVTAAVTATAGGTALTTQTDIKRRHPDGSVRHAIVSVRLPASTTPVSFALSPSSTSGSGTSVTLAQALASGVDYRVEIAETGGTAETGQTWSTTLKQALAASPSQWLSGSLVSEWRSRIAPKSANLLTHPGLRVLFDARYQSPVAGRVSIAIENVEATAARGDRTYSLKIYDASNVVVYSVADVKHYAQTRYRKILYFGATSKEMMAIVDIERLKNAHAVPNYANVTIPTSTITSQYTHWQASARGLFQSSLITPYMPMTGGRADIGPLPGWTAMALISRDPRMYQVMFDQAERAGYFNVHYRDAASGDIYNINNRPTFSLYVWYGHTPYSGGDVAIAAADRLPAPILPATTPTGWQQDTDHEPSLAYLPYLITGDRYYLDELYFWAGYHLLQHQAAYRGYDKGLVNTFQIRGQAWTMRTMGHAAWVAPDTQWQKDYFTEKLNNNLAWYRSNVLPSNPLGYWSPGWVDPRADAAPYRSGQVAKIFGPWQHHFMAYTLSELNDRGFAAADLRDFALGFSTKLFTSSPAYSPFDGTAYYLPAQLADGSPISSMSAMTAHAFATRGTGPLTYLEGYNSPDGYAIQALAALSAAIDSGVPNASTGYVFVRNEIMRQGTANQQLFVNSPTWNIAPREAVSGLSEAPGIYAR